MDCMVALPGNLFYSTSITACLWFLSRDKKDHHFRDRRRQILFIDARKRGKMVDRTRRVLTAEDIERIAGTYHACEATPVSGSMRMCPGSAEVWPSRRSRSTGMC